MNDYKIDFAADTITISKSFALAASDPATAAFHTLSKLQAAYPGMKIIRKTHRSPSKPNVNKGLTYHGERQNTNDAYTYELNWIGPQIYLRFDGLYDIII